MTQEDQNLQSLFANLNQVSRNTMIREKAGGGTGGGSDVVEGAMDPNTLMTGNPYIAKNVVEFNQGGMVGASGAPTMNNPYLEKVNALVGVAQMKNVMDGLMSASTPQAKYGMKRKYDNGGKSFLDNIKAAQDRVLASDIQKGLVPSNWREQISRRGGYEAHINSGQPLMKDQYIPMAPPMANKGMKMKKRYTNGGRF